MFYNARWYDPALGRFAQADSIVPPGVQGLDRYAYVNNNPMRYTDPSGHSTDCGLGDSYCNAGEYKPSGLILLDREQHGSRCGSSLMQECISRNNSLMNDVETYMKNHPEYQPNKDGLFCSGSAGNPCRDQAVFADIRISYWTSHTGDINEAWDLYYYYDLHATTRAQITFNPSKVDWVSAGLDGGGIIADLITFGLAGRFTNGAKIAKTTGGTIGAVDLAYGSSQIIRDPSVATGAGWLTDVAGLYIPIVPDVIGLAMNFGHAAEYQIVKYQPAILR